MLSGHGDDAHVEVALGGEVAVAGEVAEAVGDEVVLVELQAPEHVRAAGDHQAGAGVDRHVGERLGVTTVLAEVILFLAGHVVGARALPAWTSGLLEITHISRRIPERETVPAPGGPRTALTGRRRSERAFEIAEDNLGARVEDVLDRIEERPPGPGGDQAYSRAWCRRQP